ncbi:TRAP transporter large permease [Evansella halocellulosilytica]|uniref:TRAP transporter large permease n=1 Tax=Evansella halocellulosilytica TaxID=2011013 RepID=UPI000BB94B80|nr:TRAP transporter large permease [Evansella halocellulosilytica]
MVLTIMVVLLFILLILGVPIGFTFALSGFLGGWLADLPLGIVATAPYYAVASFPLLAIPFFILAGELMNRGKLIDKLVDVVELFFSWLPGRLGHVTLVSSAFLGAMTGSSVATVAAISSSVGERMMGKGYKRGYVAALTGCSGLLGVLIPPSIPLIVYGAAVGVSVSSLFLATIVPGIMMTVIYMIVHRITLPKVIDTEGIGEKEKSSSFDKDTFKKAPKLMWKSLPAMILPVIILGGIYLGVTTPTEAAAIAGVYALGVILFGRIVKFSQLPDIFYQATLISVSIMCIIAFASVFNRIMTLMQVPQTISEFTTTVTENPILFLIFVNLLLFVVGMFMETNAAVLLMSPLLYPSAMSFGIDPIHFGIILVTNIQIGLITPPMAANIFVSARINKSNIVEMWPYVLRFLVPAVVGLLIITYFPALTLWWQ